jgi:hemoglobin/transferrin/lactoferrin receptor protein
MNSHYRRKAIRPYVAALALCTLATPVAAADNESNESVSERNRIDEIVVVANRVQTKLSDTAAPVSVVTAEDIASRQSQSVFDVLRLMPSVNVGGGPRAQGEMPAIRGFDRRQIIITVDGARRNTTETLRSPLYIDPSFLNRVEVLKGASSASYGAGGLGGVMAFETISALSQLEEGRSFGTRAFAEYQSGDSSQRYGAQVYAREGSFDGLIAGAFRDSGNIRQGGGDKLDPSGSTTKTLMAKIGAGLGGDFRAELSHKYYTLDDFGPNNPQADNTFTLRQPHTVTANESIFNLSGHISDTWNMRGGLYRTSQRWVTDPYLTLTGSDIKTQTTGGSLLSSFDYALSSITNKLTLGIDGYEERNANFSNGASDPVNPLGRQTVLGAFVQDEIGIVPWLSVMPVLRWDQFKTNPDAAGVSSQTNDKVTFKGTVSLRPMSGLLAYASYGEAYRAPTVSELYQNLVRTAALANFSPNPALKPESANEIDLGLVYSRTGVIGGSDRLTSRITWFKSNVSDLISSRVIGTFTRSAPFAGTGSIFQYQNVSKARRAGVEAEMVYGTGPVDLSIAYSRVRSTDRNTGEQLFSPPDKVILGAAYAFSEIVKANWISQIVWAQDYDTTVLRRRPAYDVHDVFVSVSPRNLPLRLDLGLTNIFDKRYALYKNSTANPNTFEVGRSVRATVTARY